MVELLRLSPERARSRILGYTAGHDAIWRTRMNSITWTRVSELVAAGTWKISEHALDELIADDIFVSDIVAGVAKATLVEDYPDYKKGPCTLVLHSDGDGSPVHALWGIPRGASSPAVLITAYRPDPDRWTNGFLERAK